ncbi:MAG: ABC transporter permease [Acidimicrobiia bacterium]|nr:ABC transporter permease [Acidimicrobiia bacterium]
MLRTTMRSFWEHKRRLVSTLVAVVLGVAFMAGTFVFTDTLNKVFDDLFATVYAETDAVVQGEEVFDAEFGGARQRVDEAVLEQVRAVDGVAEAQPYVQNSGISARILDADGDAVGSSQGPPTLLESWLSDSPLNPYDLREGRGPETDDEMALNVAAADEGGFTVGDDVTLQAAEDELTYTLVGIFTAGDAEGLAGAVSADVTLAEAQRLSGQEGQLNQILVAGEEGVGEADLVVRLAPVVGEGNQAITGAQAADDQAGDIQEGLGFSSLFLQVFAAIALLVGTFIIYNTFAILVTQRSRELALLRAIGASRGQVLRSVVLEAVIVGLIASVVELLVGIGLAAGVQAALTAAGIDLPSAGLVVRPATVAIAFGIGLAVTVLAALAPAVRATRVPPVAALRDVAVDRSGWSVPRLVVGLVLVVVAVFNLAQGFGDEGADALAAVGLGALAALVGVIVLAPLAAGPLSRAIGALPPAAQGHDRHPGPGERRPVPEAHGGDGLGAPDRRHPRRLHQRVRHLGPALDLGGGRPGFPGRPRASARAGSGPSGSAPRRASRPPRSTASSWSPPSSSARRSSSYPTATPPPTSSPPTTRPPSTRCSTSPWPRARQPTSAPTAW